MVFIWLLASIGEKLESTAYRKTHMITLDFKDALKKFQKDVEQLTPALRAEANAAVADVAAGVYSFGVGQVQAKLEGTRRTDYLAGLKLNKTGDAEWTISLEGKDALAIENRGASFDMRSAMLKSKSLVSKGSRMGQPWVQLSKVDQHKYAHVPFNKTPGMKGAPANSAEIISGLRARTMQGHKQSLDKIFKDFNGNALSGNVASVKRTGIDSYDGITKYQTVELGPTGKKSVHSEYLVFRTVSENSPKGWIIPGRPGFNLFEKLGTYASEKIEEIASVLAGEAK